MAIVMMLLALAACGSSGRRSIPASSGPGQIVVDFNNAQPNDSYVVMRADGTQQRSLGIPGYQQAGFSADLAKVAISDRGTSGDGHEETWLSVSAVGAQHLRRIWTVGDYLTGRPVWDPSGKRLAFGLINIEDRGGNISPNAVADGLWAIDSDGGNPRLLEQGSIQDATWSPDGTRLAFVLQRGEAVVLGTIPSTGGTMNVLATLPTNTVSSSMSWAPQGTDILVAYTTEFISTTNPGMSGLNSYPSSGGPPQVVTPAQTAVLYKGASYSPDGKHIALSTESQRPAPPIPLPGEPSPTSTSSPAPPTHSLSDNYIGTANTDGSELKTVTPLNFPADLVGWFAG